MNFNSVIIRVVVISKLKLCLCLSKKNDKNPIAFKGIFVKNKSKYNTRKKSNFILKICFSQFVSNLFHTVVQRIGMAFLLT